MSVSPLSLSLSNDELSVVCGFLECRSLNATLSVCKRWPSVILSMRSAGFRVGDVSKAHPSFLPLLSSPFARRHVGALSLDRPRMQAKQIAMLADSLPQLRELSFTIPSATPSQQLHACAWRFPLSLRALTLTGVSLSSTTRAALIHAITQLSRLETLKLRLWLDQRVATDMLQSYELSPLVVLPRLTTLNVDFPLGVSLADALRQFPSLEHLSLSSEQGSEVLVKFLERLTLPPHTLLLQHIGIWMPWADGMAAALTRVPTITGIGGQFGSLSSLHFLKSLPQLKSLALDTLDHARITPQHVVESLIVLSRLTRLAVAQPSLACADLALILRALPELAVLELDKPSQLESLRCFAEATPTLSRSLSSLALYQLEHPALTSDEFAHLRGLSKLTHLCLAYARDGLIDDATKQALTPPSVWLPRLTRFQCD